MSTTWTVKCDGCGKVKGSALGWLSVQLYGGPEVMLRDACSASCMAKALRMLATETEATPKPTTPDATKPTAIGYGERNR